MLLKLLGSFELLWFIPKSSQQKVRKNIKFSTEISMKIYKLFIRQKTSAFDPRKKSVFFYLS